jgi:hypothetical protein
MKPIHRLAAALTFFFTFLAPSVTHADLIDELLDSTHDMRAQADLAQPTLANWEGQTPDSWTVINGGSPFSQGAGIIDDNSPGIDIGQTDNAPVASLEDLNNSN